MSEESEIASALASVAKMLMEDEYINTPSSGTNVLNLVDKNYNGAIENPYNEDPITQMTPTAPAPSQDSVMMASELVKIAKELIAFEFPNQKELDKYMHDHPKGDRSNHTVKSPAPKEKTPEPHKPSERIWYSGISKKRFEEAKKRGYLHPHKSDVEDYGDSIWLTSDPMEAREYGPVIMKVKHKDIAHLPHHLISPYPAELRKKMTKEERDNGGYNYTVQKPIPMKHVETLSDSEMKELRQKMEDEKAKTKEYLKKNPQYNWKK